MRFLEWLKGRLLRAPRRKLDFPSSGPLPFPWFAAFQLRRTGKKREPEKDVKPPPPGNAHPKEGP